MNIRTLLTENAKTDKLFIALLKTVDKFADDMLVNPTSESFIDMLDRLKEYYADKDDDELDEGNDIKILKQVYNNHKFMVNLSFKGKKYVISLSGDTLVIYQLKDNRYIAIYRDDEGTDNNMHYVDEIKIDIAPKLLEKFIKEKGVKLYNAKGIAQHQKKDKRYVYDLLNTLIEHSNDSTKHFDEVYRFYSSRPNNGKYTQYQDVLISLYFSDSSRNDYLTLLNNKTDSYNKESLEDYRGLLKTKNDLYYSCLHSSYNMGDYHYYFPDYADELWIYDELVKVFYEWYDYAH